MRIKLLPKNERPMEKAVKYGIHKLSDAELLALILHTGTRNKSAIGLAEEVLSVYPEGIGGFGSCSPEELLKIEGIGRAKACAVLAAVEFGKRIAAAPAGDRPSIGSSSDVAKLFMEELRYAKKEYFKCVLLNAKGRIISIEDISIGELSAAVVHPREAFNPAVKKSAAGIIFVHNHPSGDPKPSREDMATTKRLVDSGNLLGIRVLDHVIIGDGTFSSLLDMKPDK